MRVGDGLTYLDFPLNIDTLPQSPSMPIHIESAESLIPHTENI